MTFFRLLQEDIINRRRLALVAASDQGSSGGRQPDNVSSVFSLDLGSLIGRDSGKSPRYPEKYLKALDTSLQKVAMGQDPK